ncbi:unnamed protein product, partial [Ectocarpus sp. 13 AM-2016]
QKGVPRVLLQLLARVGPRGVGRGPIGARRPPCFCGSGIFPDIHPGGRRTRPRSRLLRKAVNPGSFFGSHNPCRGPNGVRHGGVFRCGQQGVLLLLLLLLSRSCSRCCSGGGCRRRHFFLLPAPSCRRLPLRPDDVSRHERYQRESSGGSFPPALLSAAIDAAATAAAVLASRIVRRTPRRLPTTAAS